MEIKGKDSNFRAGTRERREVQKSKDSDFREGTTRESTQISEQGQEREERSKSQKTRI
jgi:hypothetical protein